MTVKLLGGNGLVNLAGEDLHLLEVLGAEVALLGCLEVLEELLVIDGALEGKAAPVAEGLHDGLADGVLAHNVVLVTAHRQERLLQVLVRGDLLSPRHELQAKVPHQPHESGEIKRQLAKILGKSGRGGWLGDKNIGHKGPYPLVVAALGPNVLGQLHHQRQLVHGAVVNGPHRVVDEEGGEQHGEREHLDIVGRGLLVRSKSLLFVFFFFFFFCWIKEGQKTMNSDSSPKRRMELNGPTSVSRRTMVMFSGAREG